MDQFPGGSNTIMAEPTNNTNPTWTAEQFNADMDFLYDADSSDTHLSCDSSVDYAFSHADNLQPYLSSDPTAQPEFVAPCDLMFGYGIPQEVQPMQWAPEGYPEGADYDPEIGWYETAEPFAPGASFKSRLGVWFRPVADPGSSSLAPPDHGTPAAMPVPFAAIPEPSVPSVSMPTQADSLPLQVDNSVEPTIKKYKKLPKLVCPCGNKSKVPRPANAFMLYRADLRKKVTENSKRICNMDTSRQAGQQWQNESQEVKKHYRDLAEQVKAEHRAKYPNYVYKPRTRCTCGAAERDRIRMQRLSSGVSALSLSDDDDDDEEFPAQAAEALRAWSANKNKKKRMHSSPSPSRPPCRQTRSTRNAQASYAEPESIEDDDGDTVVVKHTASRRRVR